ncbi:4437_t:CDS:1, partial [Gigaspora margarita]
MKKFVLLQMLITLQEIISESIGNEKSKNNTHGVLKEYLMAIEEN